MPREIPYRGTHRRGSVRPPYVAPVFAPIPQACTHNLLVCACRPSSLVTQPITPEEHR